MLNLDQLDEPIHFLGKHDPAFFFLNLEYSYSMSSTAIQFFFNLLTSPAVEKGCVCTRAYNIYLHKYEYAYIS